MTPSATRANTAGRLSGSAKQGEILVSEAAQKAASMATNGLERRSLELKGKREPVTVYVISGQDETSMIGQARKRPRR